MDFLIGMKNSRETGKPWPKDCVWPEPLYDGCGPEWEADDIDLIALDDKAEDLRDIKDYFDGLVERGILNDSYELSDEFRKGGIRSVFRADEDEEYPDGEGFDDPDDFEPEIGEKYWIDGRFDLEAWEDDLTDHMNRLKIDMTPEREDPPSAIRQIIGYEFVNENLLRQAFTRRSFAVEHALSGCCEQLEFIGDSVLSMAVTRDMTEQLSDIDAGDTESPFACEHDEGEMTKLRSHYISKDYLSSRAAELGLGKFILYGTGEEQTDGSLEDTVEALIGAAAIDSRWNEDVIRRVVDELTAVEMKDVEPIIAKTYYDTFNAWHQSRFGEIPSYELSGRGPYHCSMKYKVPKNDQGIWTDQQVDVERDTRGAAREYAAELAYTFVHTHSLWKNINDAGIDPDPENSINQLQEIWQKGYLENKPDYQFTEAPDEWECRCISDDLTTQGRGQNKTAAKKDAAYRMLQKLLDR
ncbi:MAG: hypothetical protein IKF07_07470 [Eubacterium sp.]|nr:hypothetical protein [Eubacterium sp.]